jgi:uncharacterized membrane protein
VADQDEAGHGDVWATLVAVTVSIMDNETRQDARTLAQLLALGVGVVYTLVGVAGFFVTGFDNFAEDTGETLLGLEVNPLHNIVHLAAGLLGLVVWRRLDATQWYGWFLAVAFGGVFVLGLLTSDDPENNFMALNAVDNVIHLVTAAAGVVMALSARAAATGGPADVNRGARRSARAA